MSVAPYPHLLAPLRIAGTTLRNRIVMGAMHTRLETLDDPARRLAAFYAARAQGEAGLILTGGYAPVPEGVIEPGAPVLDRDTPLAEHEAVTRAVREAGGAIVLQILHAGRYARVAGCVAPSAGKARINSYAPRALSTEEVLGTIARYADTAARARQAGYAGVEIMGSEGYLINEFTAPLTNQRDDAFGGSFEGRIRLPLEIIRAVRARVGPAFMIVYRISAIDLVEGGLTGAEVARLARAVQDAGADLINTGIGWHESAVPTIAASVPRAAWLAAVRNVRQAVSIPVMASNRINTPEVAEALLAQGDADLVSLARPLLADPEFARKAREGRAHAINTCIACNQACLDHIFTGRTATCLVNPRAGRETELLPGRSARPGRVAVVGGGPAGMACALEAARRGHAVTLYEAASRLGGQINLARQVPGKGEFAEMLRYFEVSLREAGVDLRLGAPARAGTLCDGGFDHIVLATGVRPRVPQIPGIDHPSVTGYADLLSGRVPPGERVAVIGAGGIGFDVAEFLVGDAGESTDPAAFLRAWGVDAAMTRPGGLLPATAPGPRRQVQVFQRSPGVPGRRLGRTTGWIVKARLRRAGVVLVAGVAYEGIDDAGLHYRIDGQAQVFAADQVVLCAGQESNRTLHDALQARGVTAHCIGGADVASELDAQRAIEQAVRLAASL